MEVVLNSCEELIKQELILQHHVSRLSGCPHEHFSHSILDPSVIILAKQIWNLTNRQYRIDVLDEGLLCNLVVGEDKD